MQENKNVPVNGATEEEQLIEQARIRREKLQKLMEDPTPIKRKDSGYWDQKF